MALALINAKVDRQSTMMAHNDVSLILGGLFLATIPLLLLLPGRPAGELDGSQLAAE